MVLGMLNYQYPKMNSRDLKVFPREQSMTFAEQIYPLIYIFVECAELLVWLASLVFHPYTIMAVAVVYVVSKLFSGRLRGFKITAYDYWLRYKTYQKHAELERSRTKSVQFGDDEQGAYIYFDGRAIYLKVMPAQPLKGFLAGSNYYTNEVSEKLVKMNARGC